MNWLIKAHRRVAVIDADLYTTWEVKTLLIATSWSSVPSPVRHSAEGRRCLIRSLTERFQSLHSLHFTSYVYYSLIFQRLVVSAGFCILCPVFFAKLLHKWTDSKNNLGAIYGRSNKNRDFEHIRFSQGALTTRAALRWAATGGGHNWCSFTMFYVTIYMLHRIQSIKIIHIWYLVHIDIRLCIG